MKPSWASSSWRRSAAIATIRSSGTRSPASMYSLAFLPSSVSSLTLARSMSPVELNGSWKSARRRSACVPLPAPGGPKRMRFSCWAIGLITVSIAMNSGDRGGLLDMSNVISQISISLDGFVAGPNQSPQDPIGEGGLRLHEWAFATRAWREQQGLEGGEDSPDSELVAALTPSV